MMNSGIYKIVNEVNGKFYWGSTDNFDRRFGEHKRALSKNEHFNRHLQFAWNKYGEDNFVFEVVEKCGEEMLFEIEQKHLDKWAESNCCYNIALSAKSPMRGRTFTHTKSAKKKISEKMKGRDITWAHKIVPPNKKLADEDVAHIRWLYEHKRATKDQLAEYFGVAGNYICRIVNYNARKNIHSQKPKNADSFYWTRRGSKLTKKNANKIRKLYETGKYLQKELAEKFKCSVPTISMVVSNKIWS